MLRILMFFLIITLIVIGCEQHVMFKRKNISKNLVKEDSIKNCLLQKKLALDQIRKGNYILYANFDDFLHAKEYFFRNYRIQLIPNNIYNACAKQVMDSLILENFGDLEKSSKIIIDSLYQRIPDFIGLDSTYFYADHEPIYPGGIDVLYKDIYNNIGLLTIEENLNTNYETKISFIIDKNGILTNPQLITKFDPIIDDILLRAILKLKTKWTPALFGNKEVAFQVTVSLNLKELINKK